MLKSDIITQLITEGIIIAMTAKTEKKLPDLKTFIENVNKKDTDRNGKKVRFYFVKRKRKH
jgi:hypothetical protein